VSCSELQCVAVSRSALQCVVVCCNESSIPYFKRFKTKKNGMDSDIEY